MKYLFLIFFVISCGFKAAPSPYITENDERFAEEIKRRDLLAPTETPEPTPTPTSTPGVKK